MQRFGTVHMRKLRMFEQTYDGLTPAQYEAFKRSKKARKAWRSIATAISKDWEPDLTNPEHAEAILACLARDEAEKEYFKTLH